MKATSESERAEPTIERVPELRLFHARLSPLVAEQFTALLDATLANHHNIFGPDATEPEFDDIENASRTVRTLAKEYVEQPTIQTPWLTQYLLVEVLETQFMFLNWQVKWGVFPWFSLRHSLPSPYRTFVPPLVSLCTLAAFSGLAAWLLI